MTEPMHVLVGRHASRRELISRLAALADRPNVECLYFGCIESAGHYLWGRVGKAMVTQYHREAEASRALGPLDAALCWNGREPYGRDETQGRALLTQREGWTAIAFWDRSVDPRGACNSAFLAVGTHRFDQMVRLARRQWPEVWSRFKFEVVQVDGRGQPVR